MAEKGRRGFASMDREKQRAIASKGGKIAHQRHTAHEFTREEAREAGRKGGRVAHERGTAHQFTPEEAREAGRKGGESARRNNSTTPGRLIKQRLETLTPETSAELAWAGESVS
jgi:general stress protein YciG